MFWQSEIVTSAHLYYAGQALNTYFMVFKFPFLKLPVLIDFSFSSEGRHEAEKVNSVLAERKSIGSDSIFFFFFFGQVFFSGKLGHLKSKGGVQPVKCHG